MIEYKKLSIDKIIELLSNYDNEYYNIGNTTMTDDEYDEIKDYLKKLDKNNQYWLNSLWNYLTNFKIKDYDYYDNTIKMLNLIIISGNYWDIKR